MIDKNSILYADALWNLINNPPQRLNERELSEEELIKDILEGTREHFENYVDTVYSAHKSVRHGFEEVKIINNFKSRTSRCTKTVLKAKLEKRRVETLKMYKRKRETPKKSKFRQKGETTQVGGNYTSGGKLHKYWYL